MQLTVVLYAFVLVYGYNDVDENFDYGKVAQNPKELKSHLDCFMDKGACDNVALHYKAHILNAVWNNCKFCSAHHKHNAHMFLQGVMKQFPEEYKQLKFIYDKEGTHFKAMEDEVNKY